MENNATYIKDNSAGMDNAKKLKEKACIVAQDFDAELKQSSEHATLEKKYTLPDSAEV